MGIFDRVSHVKCAFQYHKHILTIFNIWLTYLCVLIANLLKWENFIRVANFCLWTLYLKTEFSKKVEINQGFDNFENYYENYLNVVNKMIRNWFILILNSLLKKSTDAE